MDFKQKFIQFWIPAVQETLQKEKEHYKIISDANLGAVQKHKWLKTSSAMITHLENRLEEYLAYAEGL